MNKYRVVKSRKSDNQNPLTVKKGDVVNCIEESDENGDWAGWIYSTSINKEGWIPKQIINDSGLISEDYDSKELDIVINDIILMEKTLNGWIWGSKVSNPDVKAWIPLNHLEKTFN